MALTAEQLTEANPALAAQLTADGVNAERKRIVELFDAGADHELTAQAVKDGTDPKAFYKQALDAERNGKAQDLKAFEENLSDTAGQDGKETAKADGDDFDALVDAHMEKADCSKGQAMLAMGRKHPKAHAAWLAAKN